MTTATQKWGNLGTETVLMANADLSGLANNALVLSAAYNNVQGGGGGDGSIYCRITVTLTMAVAATANTAFSFWFLKSQDGGTTYESGGTGYTPLKSLDFTVPAPLDTTQRIVDYDGICPAGFWRLLILNNATGQALKTDVTSAGSKVTVTPYTPQQITP